MTEFLTAKQVALEYLNDVCSYHKVLRLTRDGKIPATRLGKSYLYKRSQLDVWAENQFCRSAATNDENAGTQL